MVLQVNGAAGGRRGEVDLVGDECVFVGGDPVAKGVSVVSGNDRYFCKGEENTVSQGKSYE